MRWAGSAGRNVPPAEASGPSLLYVAVGASDAVGIGAHDPLREAWPQVFYRTALPRSATYVNLGIPGVTVAEALRREVPYAISLKPNLVTVWLAVNDIFAGVRPHAYERDLGRLVATLRQDGGTRVLLANTPPLDHLPAYRACFRSGASRLACLFHRHAAPPGGIGELVDSYNAAIARVARREGAVLVDLHAAGMAARARGTEDQLVSGDGFHPSSEGHRVLAAAFASALRKAGVG